ncbi:DUF4865 family protein [Rhizobium tubonense]|uniref:DUF4865 domain-containing protein n=1 Tax=Rhizobium tubonense TaxID=484088 RepID=A0A2W4E3T4_9HYPH|nr:DUF4865 family protein [Rhizobium tubonense]PZM10306.1 DUF4865 domain-containing protein [Rhizobium tubonense]
MIAMQYSFTLPADYDMSIIDRRIDDKGPLLDNFPGLKFKAYLTARIGDTTTASRENLYAPFYVWEKEAGLNDFVCGPGFAAVAGSFGRPRIRTWIAWQTAISTHINAARFATRELFDIAPYDPLDEMRKRESEAVAQDVQAGGALASVAAFEPTSWTRVRFRLWDELPGTALAAGPLAYRIGHLSLPQSV